MRVALVHDWLDTLGGADRVLIELHRMFPEAPIYTLFARKSFVEQYFPGATIYTSWLQNVPWRRNAAFAMLMASAMESFDLSEYDLVISSSSVFAKGLVLKPKTRHICYCYSPAREAWDRAHASRGLFSSLGKHVFRLWDRSTVSRVDRFVAISSHVQNRIKKFYQRDSTVVHPPLTVGSADNPIDRGYYLIVSRLYRHKNITVAIEAFNKLGYTLHIVGEGPHKEHLKSISGTNIHFLGFLNERDLSEQYRNARAFIMPQEEDFGLTPIEAMAHGKPVIALRKGGALESIKEGITGEFFDDPIPEALSDAVRRFNNTRYDPSVIESHVQRFSVDRFRTELLSIIHETLAHHA